MVERAWERMKKQFQFEQLIRWSIKHYVKRVTFTTFISKPTSTWLQLAVLSIDLVVLCCMDLDVLCIQSGSATAVAGLSCSSYGWSVLFLDARQSCCQPCCCHRCCPFSLVSLVREKMGNIALLPLLRVVVLAQYPWLG
jgi:hypothetical protein